MAAADALVASATLVLGASEDKTKLLPQVIDALYHEFGKDECKTVMNAGAKQWFEQYPLEFRINTHVQGGKASWHSVTLIGTSQWQATGSTSMATACRSEQERPADIQTFKKEVVELLARSGEIPLGHLINRHQKAYGHTTPFRPLHRALHRARSGKQATGYVQPLRALLLSEVFSSVVELVPWAAGPNPGEFVVRLTTPSSQLQRSQQLQHQQEAERLRLEAVEDEAWRALPPPQPARQLPRPPPPPQPMGQPQHRPPALPVASAAHQASSRLELRVTSRSQP